MSKPTNAEEAVGWRVSVYWSEEKQWFDGTVSKALSKFKIKIDYDDNTTGNAVINKHKLKFLEKVGKSAAKVHNKLQNLPGDHIATQIAGELAMKGVDPVKAMATALKKSGVLDESASLDVEEEDEDEEEDGSEEAEEDDEDDYEASDGDIMSESVESEEDDDDDEEEEEDDDDDEEDEDDEEEDEGEDEDEEDDEDDDEDEEEEEEEEVEESVDTLPESPVDKPKRKKGGKVKKTASSSLPRRISVRKPDPELVPVKYCCDKLVFREKFPFKQDFVALLTKFESEFKGYFSIKYHDAENDPVVIKTQAHLDGAFQFFRDHMYDPEDPEREYLRFFIEKQSKPDESTPVPLTDGTVTVTPPPPQSHWRVVPVPRRVPSKSSINSSVMTSPTAGIGFAGSIGSEVGTPLSVDDEVALVNNMGSLRRISNSTGGGGVRFGGTEVVGSGNGSGTDTPIGINDFNASGGYGSSLNRPNTAMASIAMREANTVSILANGITHWKRGQLLGAGSFGKVYAGLDLVSGTQIAVKQVRFPSEPTKRRSKEVDALETEIELLRNLDHPNIVRYFGTNRTDNRFGAFSEAVVRRYTRQILEGLAYLHANNIMHRDIKSSNMLVDHGIVKLSDFGCSRKVGTGEGDDAKIAVGTTQFMAPEIMKGEAVFTDKADIWSLGITVIEMATGKPPWPTPQQAMFKICATEEIPPIPDFLSPDAHDFLRLCFSRNPSERASAEELLAHPFLNEPDNPELFKHPSVRGVGGAGGSGQASDSKKSERKHRKKQLGKLPWDARSQKTLSNSLPLSVSDSLSNSQGPLGGVAEDTKDDGSDSSEDEVDGGFAAGGYVDESGCVTVRTIPAQATATWIKNDIANAVAGGMKMDTAEFEALMRGDS